MTCAPRRSLGHMTVGGIVKSAAVRFAEHEALFCVGTGRRFTFRQLHNRSNQLANAFAALPLERGAVVAFICSNRAEIVEIYGALAKSGLVGLPLNYRLAPAELAALIDAVGAVAVVCEARFGGVIDKLREQCPTLAHAIWIGEHAPDSCLRYEDVLSAASASDPDVDVDDQAPFYFNLTSGTTGLPKAYVLTQHSAAAIHPSILATDSRPDDVSLVLFPVFGRVGFGNVLHALTTGTRVVLTNFDAADTPRLIQDESVTIVWLVPTMAALLLQLPDVDSRTLTSLRAIGFVGSMLPPAIRKQAMSRLCPNIYEGYGLQETGFLTMSTPEDRRIAPDSVGKPLLFADVRIVDASGKRVAIGDIGEIIGRTPNCITEYYQSPAKNAEVFRDGWFHTGDLGRHDADGYLYICGRVKDMIISGGQNVHSSEIEATLLNLAGVADCAVVGLPHEVWGEMVTAVIVPATGAELTVEQVQTFCRASLASFKVPRVVAFQSDSLPRTATGKVQKFLLVERYGTLALQP